MAPQPVVPLAGPLPFISSAAIDPEQVRREARREQLVFGSDAVADRLTGETDPPYIRDAESFEGWPHKAMFEMVETMSPAAVAAVAQKCAQISQVEIGWHLLALKRGIDARWGGTAADAAMAATDSVHEAGGHLTTAITDISARLELVANLGSELKIAVPAPEVPQETLSPSEAAATRATMEDERVQVANVLKNVYLAGYELAGTNVPALPGPSTIAGPSGGWGHTYGSPNSTGTTGTTGGPGSGDPAAPGTGEGDPAATQAANAAPPGATPATGQQTGQGSGSGSPASTTAASAQNSTNPAAYGSAGGSGYAGGGGGGGSGRGADRRSGSGSGADSGMSGFAAGPMAGALGGAAGAATGAAAAPGARAVPGRPMGMPMGMPMGGAGRGAGGNDDTEHKTPSYLINMDNGNELIGKIDPVAPPVIGA